MECIINQVDPQFELTPGFHARLSILLCQEGFSFLITHATTRKILKLASYKIKPAGVNPAEMAGWPANGHDYFERLKAFGFSQQSFQRIDIAVSSHKLTIAPAEFIEAGEAGSIMSAVHSMEEGEEILTGTILSPGPVTAILVPHYIPAYCRELFPGGTLHTAASVFVKGVMQNHSQLMARQIFINIYAAYFEITVIQGSRLLYLNTFRYSAPQDVLYYVIFVLEQLGFVASEEKITLMGEISEPSTIYDQLKIYCGTLNFAGVPEGIEYGDAFEGIGMHRYFTLFNIPLCE